MSALSEHRGIQDQDPAERLAAALRRIAVGIERREAKAAATKAALDAASRSGAASPWPAAADDAQPAVVANIDSLIARLRAVLNELPPAPGGGGPAVGRQDEGS
jgi:hypothetical protein